MAVGQDPVQADVGALGLLAGRLLSLGSEVAGVASGVDRSIPPVPEDEHGVGLGFVALDEARQRLDQLTAEGFEALGRRLRQVAQSAREADVSAASAFGAMRVEG